MTFREQLAQDVQDVFLNLEEFGEEIVFDGVAVVAVIDDGQGVFSTGSRDQFANASGLGLIENARTVYLKDMAERPVPGQEVNINGEMWVVEADPASVRVEMGMLILRLSRVWG